MHDRNGLAHARLPRGQSGHITHEEATAAFYGGLLALQYVDKGQVHAGQNVLVYGASGTSGTLTVQYAAMPSALGSSPARPNPQQAHGAGVPAASHSASDSGSGG